MEIQWNMMFNKLTWIDTAIGKLHCETKPYKIWNNNTAL